MSLCLHDSFATKNKSHVSKISTKDSCDLQAFPPSGVKSQQPQFL